MSDKQPGDHDGLQAVGVLSGSQRQPKGRRSRRPYESKIPNAESLEALRQLQAGETIRYNSVEEMMDDILGDD